MTPVLRERPRAYLTLSTCVGEEQTIQQTFPPERLWQLSEGDIDEGTFDVDPFYRTLPLGPT